MRKGSRWRLVGVSGAALLCAVVIAVALGGRHEAPSAQRQELGVMPPGGPLGPGGLEVTLDEAVSGAGFALYRPHDEIADDEQVTRAWLTRGQEVALRYRSGVMAFVSPAQVRDVDSFFQAQLRDGLDGHIVRVNGGAAILVPSSPSGRTNGALDLFLNGIEIQVIGPDGLKMSLDDLARVVQSIA